MNILKILEVFLIIVLFLVIVLIVLAGIPSIGKYRLLVVLSGSMEPDIPVGSLVVVNPAQKYAVGDIITFSFNQETTPTTHRIHEINEVDGKKLYITKGDANNIADLRDVFEENIIGKVFFIIPYAGYVVDFARKPIGFGVLVFVPAGIIIFDQVQKIIQEIKKNKKKKKKKDEGIN